MYLNSYSHQWGEAHVDPWHLLALPLSQDARFVDVTLWPMQRSREGINGARKLLGLPYVTEKYDDPTTHMTSSMVTVPITVDRDANVVEITKMLVDTALADMYELGTYGDESNTDSLRRANDGWLKLAGDKPLDQFYKVFGMESEGRIRRTGDGRAAPPGTNIYYALYLRVEFALILKETGND